MSFLVLFRVRFTVFCLYSSHFGVLSNFLACFSLFALRLLLLLLSFWWLGLFLCCFASWLEMTKYWELLFSSNLTSFISRSKRGFLIFSLRGFTSTCPLEALVQCLTVCPRYATLEYAHFIVICLAQTNWISKLRTQSRLRITFSLGLPLRNG